MPFDLPSGTLTDRSTFAFEPNNGGSYVVQLIVVDDDGGLATDRAFLVVGTPGNDSIVVMPPTGMSTNRIVVFGYGGDDSIDASGISNQSVELNGGSGKNTLIGGDQGDLLIGGPEDDVIIGNAGPDILVPNHGDNSLMGGNGDDRYVIVPGSSSTLSETESDGKDTVDFSQVTTGGGVDGSLGLSLTLASELPQAVDGVNFVTLLGIFEGIIGTDFNDTFTGNDVGNNIQSRFRSRSDIWWHRH